MSTQFPYGGGGDARAGGRSLADRFRGHAGSLERSGRSPLYSRLMRSAADDIDARGVVAELFEGVPVPPGSVPQLRLLGALHYLVLSGQASELAGFYPSAGGARSPERVWPVARAATVEHFGWLRRRVHRTVQTNEPGRSAVLFGALLWLTARYGRPIRLLEIGASAGLNLLADRYCYVVDGRELGDPASPLRFEDPWAPPPPIDVEAAWTRLRIVDRAGCDLTPLDPAEPDDQLTLLSYIWPDELDRIERLRAALSVAIRHRVPITAKRASEWLTTQLGARGEGELTVVWHSVMRQYVEPEEWEAIERALDARPGVVRLSMEPSRDDHLGRQQLAICERPGTPETVLALAGDHGLPICWDTYSPPA